MSTEQTVTVDCTETDVIEFVVPEDVHEVAQRDENDAESVYLDWWSDNTEWQFTTDN